MSQVCYLSFDRGWPLSEILHASLLFSCFCFIVLCRTTCCGWCDVTRCRSRDRLPGLLECDGERPFGGRGAVSLRRARFVSTTVQHHRRRASCAEPHRRRRPRLRSRPARLQGRAARLPVDARRSRVGTPTTAKTGRQQRPISR